MKLANRPRNTPRWVAIPRLRIAATAAGRTLGPPLTAIAAAVCGSALIASPPASAAPLGQCTTHSGTIVAVDFQHWGGPVVRGCGVGQRSGYDLLHAAGFTTAGDQHDGPSFICRLGDTAFHGGTQYPTPKEDDCVLTPPGSAYWSYWLASAGQSTWTYSQLNAMGEVPKPGEVELWMFGGTNIAGSRGSGVPTFSPATLRARNAQPTTAPRSASTTQLSSQAATGTRSHTTARKSTAEPHPPSSNKHHSSSSPTTASRSGGDHGARSSVRHPTADQEIHPRHDAALSATPTATSKAGGSTASSATGTAPPLVAARETKQPTSSTSAAPLAIGISLVLLLCGGAGWTIWRRRRYE
jgi:hypothetical protein